MTNKEPPDTRNPMEIPPIVETAKTEPPESDRPTGVKTDTTLIQSEHFTGLPLEEQTLALQKLGELHLPEGYWTHTNIFDRNSKTQEPIGSHEHFIYKENTRESLAVGFLEEDLQKIWDTVLEKLGTEEFAQKTYNEKSAIITPLMIELYHKVTNSKDDPSQEWLHSFLVPISNCVKRIESFEYLKPKLETYFNKLLRQGIESRLEPMRLEFKIHLNPHNSSKLMTVEALMELIRDDEFIQKNVREFKVSCKTGKEEDSSDSDGHRAPDIVIYPEHGSTPEESMRIVHEFVERLQKKLAGLEDSALPVATHTPRFNFPITRMIHVAQSEGQLKYSLLGRRDDHAVEEAVDQWICPKPGRVKQDTMISGFFDPRGNHAFLNDDAKKARELFGGLQNDEARSYIQEKENEWNDKIKEADKLREKHNSRVPTRQSLVKWLKSLFK